MLELYLYPEELKFLIDLLKRTERECVKKPYDFELGQYLYKMRNLTAKLEKKALSE